MLISAVCCILLPFTKSSEDEVVSSVHLEDTWRTLTEADLKTELHLPRDSKLLMSLNIRGYPYVNNSATATACSKLPATFILTSIYTTSPFS